MSLEQETIHGEEARQLLENRILKNAIARMEQHLEQRALECPDDGEAARKVVSAKQILRGIIREIERIVSDGDYAKIQLTEIERQSNIKKIFRR